MGASLNIVRIAFGGACLATIAALVTAHGIQEKPFYNGKTNFTTRGGTTAAAAQLYMMQPPLYHTGSHETIGFRSQMQDQEAATKEVCIFSFVKYARDGKSPDESPTGEILNITYPLFGFGDKGSKAYSFVLTTGFPRRLPDRHGIGIGIAANARWPRDGCSIHAQLNVKTDSRHLRVQAPFDKQVWAFEKLPSKITAQPLGGRTLDILHTTGLFIEPTLQAFIKSPAYGLGTETLYGPESMHPSAARGDQLGYSISGGQIGADGWGFIFLSDRLAPKPIPFPPALIGNIYLNPSTPLFPILLHQVRLDSMGAGTSVTIPFLAFPAKFRNFWAQCMIVNPFTMEVELTDAVGVRGQ